MNSINIKIKTLTPIWTGGIDRNSNNIHETGILGSLRWWYEGIVRGMGGLACDPIKDSCTDSSGDTGKCVVCELFGCKGWSKKFRLEIKNIGTIPLFFVTSPNVYISNGNWLFRIFGGVELGGQKTGRGVETEFNFNSKTIWSVNPIDMFITPLRGINQEIIDIFSYILWFSSQYGGIGAKTQNGFGQVMIVEGIHSSTIERGKELIKKIIDRKNKEQKNEEFKGKQPFSNYFSTENFFSNLYSIPNTGYATRGRVVGIPHGFDYKKYYIPCSFDIRYKSQAKNPFTGSGENVGLRPLFNSKFGRSTTKKLLGETTLKSDQDRSASKVCVSHLFKTESDQQYKLKIWGYVTEDLGKKVDEISQVIDDFVINKMFPQSTKIQYYVR